MNRYPVWKYAILVIVLALGLLYSLPNLFGEAPAVQVSPARSTVKVDAALQQRIEEALASAGITPTALGMDATSVRARFESEDTQFKARDAIEKALISNPADPAYIVAFGQVSRSPAWLTGIKAAPMYLGLDLRGGVHFMLQVDMQAALTKKVESYAGDLRIALREKNIRHGGISRDGQAVDLVLRDPVALEAARKLIAEQFPDLQLTDVAPGTPDAKLRATIKLAEVRKVQDQALKQNMTTLHNRINELGVAEPVIQQQGLDRIVVQLPGVQDPAKAQNILGRTATLEMRLVDESTEGRAAAMDAGPVPFGSQKFPNKSGGFVVVKRQVLVTGENLTDAQTGFDAQNNEPNVSLTMDAKGGRIMRDTSLQNLKKGMAIILFEKDRGEAISVATIQGELGTRFQISGRMNATEASDLALLLRAGSLAAPMEIVEQFTIGPSLGADNIKAGINSVVWGLAAIAVFMCLYYMLFGVISSIALGVNVLLLVAILSTLQATLTLPGIAAMALAIGVAIDSNVLINERIREELRAGVAPQAAIHVGYDRAWATILDSNVTTLIAGLALLAFGSGPVRGFAVVHCIGILTSMFSAVFFSRGLVNIWYGGRKKLKSVSIGQVWKPEGSSTAVTPSN